MKEGHKLFITAYYAFKYDDSHYEHIMQFDILTQFFEHRNNLKGYINDEDGPRVEEGSDVAILMDDLYKGFENHNIPEVVEKYLHEYEMYEVLAEYNSPLSEEALNYKKELLTQEV